MSNYRDRALLDLAHAVHVCQHCGKHAPSGCEPAHANWSEYGKGAMLKAHDWAHAAMCHECHAALDQGAHWTRDERRAMWERAFLKTLALYWVNGWLKVA